MARQLSSTDIVALEPNDMWTSGMMLIPFMVERLNSLRAAKSMQSPWAERKYKAKDGVNHGHVARWNPRSSEISRLPYVAIVDPFAAASGAERGWP